MSDCRIPRRCEVCAGVEKLTYTVTRHGLKEDYRNKQTFSGTAMYCPKCGSNVHPWTVQG